ncbi:unnamed protein product [Aureobasidium vineae]|uniref:Nonribosomal peptide synthetase sidD N-terminal domain-containing protein n=1 Tax=Aureobasidium vineae TaxID=2773715 RepID=A0A9N8JNV0_9PEZI|nr:unnamed protein product [Aureobasidium vineae]
MGYKHSTEFESGAVSGTSRDCGFSYNMIDLYPQSTSTPTGMREDIVLASWLIVLLRTREGECVSFDWTYHSSSDELEEPIKHISMDKVTEGLQDSIDNVVRTISDQISIAESIKETARLEPVSLLLSTNILSQQSGDSTVRARHRVQ